jgi:outer membrane protein assembly factor BamB
VLIAAIARAGWPPVGPGGTLLLPEPVGAARYFADVLRRPVPVGAAVGVYDFGGGTLDIALVRNQGADAAGRATFVVVGTGGVAELGGLDLDAALVEHLGRLLASSAPQAWERLSRPRTATQWRDRRQFWDDVRGAKEMLSRTVTAPVPVPGVDQAVHLTRDELERMVAPLLHRGVLEAGRVIADAGLRPEQVAGLFLVGGSSRVPLVARMLHAELGLAPTVLEQPELPVAEGALAELLVPAAGAAPAYALQSSPGSPSAPSGSPSSGVPPSGPPAPGVPGQNGTGGFPPGGAPPYPGSLLPPFAPPPGPRRPALHRRAATWIAAAAAVAVLAAAGAVALYLNRGPGDLSFRDVSEVARIPTGEDPPNHAFTDFYGDRAYLAWQENEQLQVIALDGGSGKERWRHTMSARPDQWSWIRAYPDVLLVSAYASGTSDPREVYAVNTDNGKELWRHAIYGEDRLWTYDEVVVRADNERDRLIGLDIRTGAEEWTRNNPKGEYDYTDASVFAALTEADIGGPASASGGALAPVLDDDYRLVQIGSDRKARVIDARTGKVLRERGNVGDPDGNYLVYEGRLYAAGTAGGYQIAAYDLDKMGEPRNVYRAADGDRALVELDACGDDRLCVLDSRSSAADTTEVAAVSTGDAGQLWRQKAAGADILLPLGDRVVVANTDSTDPSWVLRDDKGKELAKRDGTAVRLDAGNALSFAGGLSTISTDISVAGVAASGGDVTELGPLRQARGETCSWSSTVIACMADTDFVLWRFAE